MTLKPMSTKTRHFLTSWLPLICYCGLIYFQSSHPSPKQIPSFPFVDKVLHFVAYGIMAVLFFRAYHTLEAIRSNHRLLMLIAVVSATLYGVSDEIHQSFVPFRTASSADALADFLGALCGVWLYKYNLPVVARFDWWKRIINAQWKMRKANEGTKDG